MSRAFATFNGTNLDSWYGMRLTGYNVGTPEADVKFIDVPGRPGRLDATTALTGAVTYKSRKVEASFHLRDCDYAEWHTLLSELFQRFDGTESKMIFSTDPNWYYKGRFTLDTEKTDKATGTIVISCPDAFPYKLEAVEIQGTISGATTVTAQGKDYNGPVTLWVSTAMTVSFLGQTYQLTGNRLTTIHDIVLRSGNNSLVFTGSGTATVRYERGIL